MTPEEVRRLARKMYRRLEWVHDQCQEIRRAADEGDELAAALWAELEENEIGVSWNVPSIARDAIRRWRQQER